MRATGAVVTTLVGAIVAACGGDFKETGHVDARARIVATFEVNAHGVGSGIDARLGERFWMVGDHGVLFGAHVTNGNIVVDDTIVVRDGQPLDTEEARALPGGGFLVAEESTPSVLFVDGEGAVRARLSPGAGLPAVLALHRKNRGFESLAVSRDGTTAFVATQSPLGDANDPRFSGSRVIRLLRLDVSHPMHASLRGEYALRLDDGAKLSAAAWVDDDRVLLLERDRSTTKLLLADLRDATSFAGTAIESTLDVEDVNAGPEALGISPVGVKVLFTSRDTPELEGEKLEGLALLDDATIALSNDDDFSPTGRSRVWEIELGAALR